MDYKSIITVSDIHISDSNFGITCKTPMPAGVLSDYAYDDLNNIFAALTNELQGYDVCYVTVSPIVSDFNELLNSVKTLFNGSSLVLRSNGFSICEIKCDGEFTYTDCNVPIIDSRQKLREYAEHKRISMLEKLFDEGIDIPCFDGVEISPLAKVGKGTLILSGTKIYPQTVIGENCIIGPGSIIEKSEIGNDCTINNTKVLSSKIENNVKIGPYCNIRPNCHIRSGVKIGDFVEVKNSVLGEDTHASHLTYIGDSDVGARVNFGCGTVTSNYDGTNKFRTVVEDDAFIGCNTNLVAPVTVKKGAYTAAGSTITDDVPEDSLAIARSRQTVVNGWVKKRNGKK